MEKNRVGQAVACLRRYKVKVLMRQWGPVVILLLTCLAYGNIFRNELVWSDVDYLVEWKAVQDWKSNVAELMLGAVPAGYEGIYQPVKNIVMEMSYGLWGINPLGYHMEAVVMHLLATWLVYLIGRKLFESEEVALVMSGLFGLHPANVEAVAWVTASFETMGIVVMLVSWYGYLRFVDEQKWRWCGVSLMTGGLAMFMNTVSLTLPVLLLLSKWMRTEAKTTKISWRRELKWWLIYVVMVGLYGYVRLRVAKVGWDWRVEVGGWREMVWLLALTGLPFWGRVGTEKYLYLVSVGWSCGLGWLLTKQSVKRVKVRKMMVGGMVGLIGSVYLGTTMHKNLVWRNEVSLWSEVVRQRPAEAVGRVNLAMAYLREQKVELAAKAAAEAVKIDPNSVDGQQVAANAFFQLEKYERTEDHVLRMVELEPDNAGFNIQAGDVFWKLEKWGEAREYYQKAWSLNADNGYVEERLRQLEKKAGAR